MAKRAEDRDAQRVDAAESSENSGSSQGSTQEATGKGARDEFVSDSNKCPECGEPIDNVRKTCANCGYEYQDGDYDQSDAGDEFMAGSNVDDSGEEITDQGPGVEQGAE